MFLRRIGALATTFLASTVLITGIPAHAAPSEGFAAAVPDTHYRSCITDKLKLDADATPTIDQLASITSLSCSGRGITDLTGTTEMPNLTKLFLSGNTISDVTPLSGATKIFSLGLEGNELTDISPLASLTKLTNINVAKNHLRDLSALAQMPDLTITSFGQTVTGSGATVGTPAPRPSFVDQDATSGYAQEVSPTTVTMTSDSVTYAEPGTYTWTFKNASLYFNGTITVEVVAAPTEVAIPDARFRECVDKAAGISDVSQVPTAEQMAAISSLTCTSMSISDLSGAQWLTGLTEFSAASNAISDLRPLAGLSLEKLQLNSNEVSDLSPLTANRTLVTLELDNNQVTSLTGLGSKPELTDLSVSARSRRGKAKLASLRGIERAPKLSKLIINNAAINDLSPLAGLSNLRQVNALRNEISDVTPLAGHANLTSYSLDGNHIRDLSPLKDLTKISKESVRDQRITLPEVEAETDVSVPQIIDRDGTALAPESPAGVTASNGTVTYPSEGSYTWKFTNKKGYITETFSGNVVQPVTPKAPEPVGVSIPDQGFRSCLAGLLHHEESAPITVEQLGGLTEVNCAAKGISDLTGAEHLTGATKLGFASNTISDLAPLAGLTQVTELILNGNNVSDLTPLSGLTSLQMLLLDRNHVASLAPLANLTSLTNLTVSQKKGSAELESLAGIEKLTGLTRLVANNQKISDLSPISGLTSLDRLYLSNNKISDLTPVSGLTSLTHLGLNTNEISDVAPLAGLTKISDLDVATNHIVDLSPLKGLPIGAYGLKARWQTVTLGEVPAEQTVSQPSPRFIDGSVVTPTAPDGIKVSDGNVTYPAKGSYTWTFINATNSFGGTIIQPVGEPVADAANIPDSNLRSCLSEAAGLDAAATPTEADVATIASADCSGKAIASLKGAELLSSATTLNLASNPISDLSPIGGLTGLRDLNLSDTGLTSVQDLAGLTGLETLTVDRNHVVDLSPLQSLPITSLSARDQTATLEPVAGGVVAPRPTITDRDGSAAQVTRDGQPVTDELLTFDRAGNYELAFANATQTFTGTLTQPVTSDVVDPTAQAGAVDCVRAGNVWVFVERDTGLQEGGCATEFDTGLVALKSAGFAVDEAGGFLNAINGYPRSNIENHYWSYYQAEASTVVDGKLAYSWTYSQLGVANSHPKPGTVEGWRFVDWTVTPSPQPSMDLKPLSFGFVDVPQEMMFYDDIMWLASTGITTGWSMPDGTREYRPLQPINRDAMAAFLYRMAGSPDYTAPEESPFTDVPATSQFYKEIAWLADTGISTGWSMPDGTREYRPLQPINRDAMAAFLYRYTEKVNGEDLSGFNAPAQSPFTDIPTTSQFYREIAWLADRGITTGWDTPTGKQFRGLQPINRDAMAAFLHRMKG